MKAFSTSRRVILSALLSSGVACGAMPVYAQTADAQATTDASADAGQPGDIIVTAQKRAQSVNSVGMSITALSADTLQNVGVTNVQDLVKVTPGLTFAQSALGTPVYTIRGIGFYESTLAASPTVSVYVDEIPLPFSPETQGATLDIERVEVLKGPQGTLYGQNSTGGAINYIAARPTDSVEAGATVNIERFGLVDANAYVSGPVTSTLGVRASVRTVQGGAWQRSITRPDDELGTQDQVYARLIAEWRPTEKLHVLMNVNRWYDRSDAQAVQAIALTPATDNTPTTVNYDPRLDTYPFGPYGARKADWSPTSPMRKNQKFFQASTRIDYELNDLLQVSSLTAFQRYSRDDNVDVDGTPFRIFDGRTGGKARTFYQELRLSATTDKFHGMIGGNYERDRTTGVQDYTIVDSSLGHPLGAFGTLPIFRSDNETTQNIRTWAVFGNAEYQLTERLKLTAGARYTKTKRVFDACLVNTPDGSPGINLRAISNAVRGAFGLPAVNDPIPVGGCIGLDDISGTYLPSAYHSTLKEDNVSWRGELNYELGRGGILYASVSRGYKAGGFAAVGASLNSEYTPATQESVTAYEAGFKLPLLDRKVQFNAAAFYYDYKDKQLRGRIADPVFGAVEQLINVPKSRVVGGEAELVLRPVRGLTASLSGTYVNSKIQSDNGNPFVTIDPENNVVDFTGSPFPLTPKWSGSANIDYEWSMGDLKPFVGLTAYGQSKTNYFFTSSAFPQDLLRIKGYGTLDLRAGVGAQDDSWRVMFFGRNVTNTQYWTSAFQTDTAVRFYAKPVTYGVQLSVKYR